MKRVFSVVGLLLLTANGASAAPITWAFSGTVDVVDAALGATFSSSQTMAGSVTYDIDPSFVCAGSCQGADALQSYAGATDFSITVGSYTATFPTVADANNHPIQVTNDFSPTPRDSFSVSARLTGTPLNGFNPLAFLGLNDYQHTLLPDADLANVNLSAFIAAPDHFNFWYLAFSDFGGNPQISGNITAITQVTAVPEPSSLMLLGGGILALARKAWRRS
jgi:hypothetical protein